MLFVGTEFGVFVTLDGGKIWNQITGNIPTVKVPDITIQERECDLVVATFGRGFYILDDYSPLRQLKKETREKEAFIFPVKDALMYVEDGGRYGQGSNFYYAPNPAFGATFTYYLKEIPKTMKEFRMEKEEELVKNKKPIPIPTLEEQRIEANQLPPYLLFSIYDNQGKLVRELSARPSKGTSRITWDLRYNHTFGIGLNGEKFDPFSTGDGAFFALPGTYTVSMAMVFNGEEKVLAGPIEFIVKALENNTLPTPDRTELVAFQAKVMELVDVVNGADEVAKDLMKRVQYAKQGIQNTPQAPYSLMAEAVRLEKQLDDILWAMNGEVPKASDEENRPAPPPIQMRLGAILSASFGNTSAPTQTQRDQYALLEEELPPVLAQLKQIAEVDIRALESEMDRLGVPWTPGRIPEWKK